MSVGGNPNCFAGPGGPGGFYFAVNVTDTCDGMIGITLILYLLNVFFNIFEYSFFFTYCYLCACQGLEAASKPAVVDLR